MSNATGNLSLGINNGNPPGVLRVLLSNNTAHSSVTHTHRVQLEREREREQREGEDSP